MALPTQPNGSSIVPLATTALTGGTQLNRTAQTELTINQGNGGTDSTAITVIIN